MAVQTRLSSLRRDRRIKLTRKIGSQQTNIARERRAHWLVANCCLVQNQNKIEKNRYSCKSVSKKHNDLYFECYKDVLDVLQKTGTDSGLEGEDTEKPKYVGFRVYNQDIVTHK